ncbi:hypothetical protein V6N13_017941 [Hibiscus sabdariffa]
MEAGALLKWKATLDNDTQTLLSHLWPVKTSHCNWVGITCRNTTGSVTGIALNDYDRRLRGTLDNLNLLAFPNLTSLQLRNNSLYGRIPSGFGNHSKLGFLDLSDNNFHSSIPEQLSNNHLTGSLPDNLCLGRVLTHFGASNNNLTGRIPSSLRDCRSLYRVRLEGNHFTGNISNAFESSSYLVGEIPKELGALQRMSRLLLSGNQFSGKIPSEIGLLSNLEQLNLASNNLSGPIPDNLGNCSKLFNLNLSKKNLGWSIPSSVGYINALQSLDLSQNSLIGGPIPDLKAFHEASFDDLRNNKGLCGNATGLKPCVLPSRASHGRERTIKVAIFVVVSLFGVLLLLFVLARSFFTFSKKTKTRESESNEEQLGAIFTVLGFNGRVLHDNIIEATEDFSSEDRQILLKDVIDQRLSPPVSKAAKDMVSAMKIANLEWQSPTPANHVASYTRPFSAILAVAEPFVDRKIGRTVESCSPQWLTKVGTQCCSNIASIFLVPFLGI